MAFVWRKKTIVIQQTKLARPALLMDETTFELLMDCIHCGFCLPTCPTFALTGNETDSPRGRLYYMRLLAEGRITPTENVLIHIDRCLDCRACETACPSGVQYGFLMEFTRSQLRKQNKGVTRNKKLYSFLAKNIFPYPNRLEAILFPIRIGQALRLDKLDKLVGDRFNQFKMFFDFMRMVRMLPPMPSLKWRKIPTIFPAELNRKLRVGLLTGCVGSVLFSRTNWSAAKVLTSAGCDVIVPPDQLCCGALLAHMGYTDDACSFAKKIIQIFEGHEPLDAVVVTSAGCGAMMKSYGHLLCDSPEFSQRAKVFEAKVKDFSEVLDNLEFQRPLKPLRCRVTYHDPCHMAHAQKIRQQPRRLIQRVPGVKFVEMPEADWCCGGAGIYNLLQYDFADEILKRKFLNIKATGVEVVVTSNPGCLMQLWYGIQKNNLKVKLMHLADFLESALA